MALDHQRLGHAAEDLGNPLRPTIGETIDLALGEEEAAVLEAHLRPLVEAGEGTNRLAYAYLTAVK